jgi:hypothetical protein
MHADAACCAALLQRQPDKRAPATVSLAFTGLALAPLLLLLLGAGTLQANFKVGGGGGSSALLVCTAAVQRPGLDALLKVEG